MYSENINGVQIDQTAERRLEWSKAKKASLLGEMACGGSLRGMKSATGKEIEPNHPRIGNRAFRSNGKEPNAIRKPRKKLEKSQRRKTGGGKRRREGGFRKPALRTLNATRAGKRGNQAEMARN